MNRSSRFCCCLSALALVAICLAVSPQVHAQALRILFLHHSCGENLINEGGVREGLAALGYELYDHGYNDAGLRLADGSYSGRHFDVPGDNTDPDGLAEMFAQPLHDPPDNAFSHLMQYDVIAFKSCFPVSNIGDDDQLNAYKAYYLAIRDRIDRHPDKLFVIVTQPPQVPNSSDRQEAARARAFVTWLQADEYLGGRANLVVFDFFGHLAGEDGFLRREYRIDAYDAHPNERANRTIGPLFVAFVDQAIRAYGVAAPGPAPTTAPAQATSTPAPTATPQTEPARPTPPPVTSVPATGLIDDFQSGAGHWESGSEEGSTAECAPDAGAAHGGTTSLRLNYTLRQGGWADCMHSFEDRQDWGGSTGLTIWLRAEGPARSVTVSVTVMVFSGDPMAATPFEAHLDVGDEWAEHVLLWSAFERADWADAAGLKEVDLARMLGYGFNVDASENSGQGSLWIDDVRLYTGLVEGAAPAPASTSTREPTVTPRPSGGKPAPAATPTPVPEMTEAPTGQEPSGGICPLSAMALPAGALGLVLACRQRQKERQR